MKKICYRKLRKYKYQLRDDYEIQIDITPENKIETDFLILDTDGKLTIKKKYAWDGPSGPTIDTKNFMRGSLVHDALYQLIRLEHVSIEKRKYADDLLKEHCIQDGMSKFRAWYVHKAVRCFGKKSALATDEYTKLIYAP